MTDSDERDIELITQIHVICICSNTSSIFPAIVYSITRLIKVRFGCAELCQRSPLAHLFQVKGHMFATRALLVREVGDFDFDLCGVATVAQEPVKSPASKDEWGCSLYVSNCGTLMSKQKIRNILGTTSTMHEYVFVSQFIMKKSSLSNNVCWFMYFKLLSKGISHLVMCNVLRTDKMRLVGKTLIYRIQITFFMDISLQENWHLPGSCIHIIFPSFMNYYLPLWKGIRKGFFILWRSYNVLIRPQRPRKSFYTIISILPFLVMESSF